MSVAPQVIPHSHLEQLREARQILAAEGEALLALSARLDAGFCAAVSLLADCRGCVIVSGIGKAGLIGRKIAATLSSTGTRSHFLHPAEAVHGDLGCLGGGDVLLLLSNSGETEEVCRLVPSVRQLEVPIVALTASAASTLGAAADATIALGALEEAGLHGLAPSTSTTAMLAVGDALALVLSRLRGFTRQQFSVFHPGGSLGRKLTSVCEIMRGGDDLRVASENASVRDVFVAAGRPGRRSGAVLLVDEFGRLSGIFTDSDLARLLEARRDRDLDQPIREVMTIDPLTIAAEATLADALVLLRGRQISELPVVNDRREPLGLIDITDVVGLLPVDWNRESA